MDGKKSCLSTSAEVREFCESVSVSATKNITLLKAIEQTVEWLTRLQKHALADSDFATRVADEVKKCQCAGPLDADGTICASFEQAEEILEKLHALLISKRDSAYKDPELQGDDREAVVDEYTEAISHIAILHNAMMDLRWSVGEHDAELEKPIATFAAPEDLKAYLQTL